MRRIVAAFIGIFLLLSAGCTATPVPEDTVKRFVSAAQNFDFQAMAQEIDPATMDPEDNWEEMMGDEQADIGQEVFLDYFQENAAKIEYEILDTNVDGETATVNTKFRYVNGAPLMRDAFTQFIGEMFALAFSGVEVSEEEATQKILDILENKRDIVEPEFVEENIEISLVLKDGRWYIEEMSEALSNVIISNFGQLSEEMEGFFSE